MKTIILLFIAFIINSCDQILVASDECPKKDPVHFPKIKADTILLKGCWIEGPFDSTMNYLHNMTCFKNNQIILTLVTGKNGANFYEKWAKGSFNISDSNLFSIYSIKTYNHNVMKDTISNSDSSDFGRKEINYTVQNDSLFSGQYTGSFCGGFSLNIPATRATQSQLEFIITHTSGPFNVFLRDSL
jgi:hypothetical protein